MRTTRVSLRSSVTLTALALVACHGSIDRSGPRPDDPEPSASGGSSGRGTGPSSSGGSSSAGAPAADDSVAVNPLRRLTRAEYNNTVRDLLRDATQPGRAFAGDEDAGGTGYGKGGNVAAVDARQLLEAAESLAASAVKNLGTLLPCNPLPTAAAAQEQCARDFIHTFGLRAFRRPLLTEEETALVTYYRSARTDLAESFADGIRLVLQVMLQSPSFLYRWELGPSTPSVEGAVVKFNDYEIASRLSYALWASMPDQALFDAAAAGKLRTVSDVEAQARRMLADAKTKDMLTDFEQQWLGVANLTSIKKDPAVYPKFDAATAAAMEAEGTAFMASVVGAGGDGKLETLLTSPATTVDAKLAALYGVTAAGAGAPTKLDPAQRSGILTQAAFLTAHAAPGGSHPVQRGKWIYQRLLCGELPVPPAVIPELPAPGPNVSTRDRFAAHGESACAKACHERMDPLGFAFEHYDGIGGWRAMDGGKPVDARAKYSFGGTEKSFDDAIGLTKLLATASEVRDCAVKQLARYTLRRHEAEGDAASLGVASDAFAQKSYDLRELLVALTKTRSFFYRQPADGEVLR